MYSPLGIVAAAVVAAVVVVVGQDAAAAVGVVAGAAAAAWRWHHRRCNLGFAFGRHSSYASLLDLAIAWRVHPLHSIASPVS